MNLESRKHQPQNHHRRRSIGAGVAVALGLMLLSSSVLTAPAAHAGVVIHSPESILSQQTYESDGRLYFQDRQGRVWEFITDINDPAILNKGSGAFSTAPLAVVNGAIKAITYPLDECSVEIFVLPYPRRGLLKSSADDNAIYISPGVAPYLESQLHALVAHEMGHIAHHQFMSDSDVEAWDAYRRLRGIEDVSLYHDQAMHKDRPHEIFAEDFRYLFGGPLANYSGSIENQALVLPTQIRGLETFLLSLAGGHTGLSHDLPGKERRLQLFPNPTYAGVSILAAEADLAAGQPADLRVFDVRGRLVASSLNLDPADLHWDGRRADGTRVAPGVYFVLVQQTSLRWSGKVLVSR